MAITLKMTDDIRVLVIFDPFIIIITIHLVHYKKNFGIATLMEKTTFSFIWEKYFFTNRHYWGCGYI